MDRHDLRRAWAKTAVPLIIAAGFAVARTGAAQDPPAPVPVPAPSATPPAPAEPAPPPPPAPAPTPPATEEPYPDEPPPAPAPVPAPTATTPPPPPTTPPTAAGYPPSYPPARTAQPAPPPPPARTAMPPAAPTARAPVAEPQPAPAAAGRSDETPKEDEDDSDGLFGPFRIGPVVGIGLPSVLSFGGTVKLTRFLGGGINIGMIPTIKVAYYGEATVSYQHYEAYGRLYPFGGAFFLGAGVGYATIKGSLKTTQDLSSLGVAIPELGSSLTIESEGSVRTMMLSPTLGFFHTFGSGFSIGIEGGAQVPIAPSEVTLNTTIPSVSNPLAQPYINDYFNKNDKQVRDQLEKMGQTILPTFGIKIGWLL